MILFSMQSMKGGVGKTSAAVNLGAEWARCGLRVLLVDLDGQGSASFHLGQSSEADSGKKTKTKELLLGDKKLRANITESPYEGLYLLPSSFRFRNFATDLEEIKNPSKHFRETLLTLGQDYDLLILDCPAGLDLLAEVALKASDRLLVPLVPSPICLNVWNITREFLAKKEILHESALGFWSMSDQRKSIHQNIMKQGNLPDLELLKTSIPYAADIEKASLLNKAASRLSPLGRGGKAFRTLAAEIIEKLMLKPRLV